MTHLTFEEYEELGGKLDEASFTQYLISAEAKLKYFTSRRINKFKELPLSVKQLIVKMVDFLAEVDKSASGLQMSNGGTLAGYSNGIESFSFNNLSGKSFVSQINSQVFSLCQEYLADYPELLYRGVGRNENFGNYSE